MRLKPRGRWLRFRAVEELAVAEVAFTWRARFPLVPLLWLDVVDAYERGTGELAGRLWGRVRLMHDAGPALDEGEALRYLAELPWAPHAMAANPALEWRQVGPQAVEVRTRVGAAALTARLHFDAAGDIVASSAVRPRPVGRHTAATRWGGRFAGYATLGGVRIPTRAEVGWQLSEGPFTYFRGHVVDLTLT